MKHDGFRFFDGLHKALDMTSGSGFIRLFLPRLAILRLCWFEVCSGEHAAAGRFRLDASGEPLHRMRVLAE